MHQRDVLLQPADEGVDVEMDVVAAELILEDLLGRRIPRNDHGLVALDSRHLQAEVLANQPLEVLPRDGHRVLLEEREAEPLEGRLDVERQNRLVRVHRIERLLIRPVYVQH